MIKEIEDLLNDSIMNTIARCYNSTRDQLKLLGGFESHVFEFTKENKDYILKITHTIRRIKKLLTWRT